MMKHPHQRLWRQVAAQRTCPWAQRPSAPAPCRRVMLLHDLHESTKASVQVLQQKYNYRSLCSYSHGHSMDSRALHTCLKP